MSRVRQSDVSGFNAPMATGSTPAAPSRPLASPPHQSSWSRFRSASSAAPYGLLRSSRYGTALEQTLRQHRREVPDRAICVSKSSSTQSFQGSKER